MKNFDYYFFYDETFFDEAEATDFTKELKEDGNCENIKMTKTDDGWLVKWEEKAF